MNTNDEPLSTYRPAYVAGLERRVVDQQAAIAQAVDALEAVEWLGLSKLYFTDKMECPWCAYNTSDGHAANCTREAALAALRGLQMG